METTGLFLARFGNAIIAIALDAGVFMLFGFVIAGLLHSFVSAARIQKYLGTGRFGAVLKASLIGLPLPLCSCGVLPAAMALHKNGASKGATVSFLISTPETGVDSIAISFALLDPVMAVFRPIAAFITALVTGMACDIVKERNKNSNNIAFHENECCAVYFPESRPKTIMNRLHHGMRFAFVDMFNDLGKWLVIGILIAAAITALVPEGFFERYIGNNFLAMLLMLVVGIPLYMCSTSSTPLAASLIFAGISPGAALVLLLVGPATNAAGITVLAKRLGLRTTAVYLAGIAVVSIAMGLLLDGIYGHIYGPHFRASALVGQASETLPPWLRVAGAVALAALLLWSLGKQAVRLARGERIACPCDTGAHELNPDNPCNAQIAREFNCKCARCDHDEEHEDGHQHDHTHHTH
jgi:hypothetical protein